MTPLDADLRIRGTVERTKQVTIMIDGTPVTAFAGESVAAALWAAGYRWWRTSPRAGEPRGLFCAMGVCQECVLRVDGRVVTACTEPVRDGLQVTVRGPSSGSR